MNIFTTFLLALRALWRHKVRTFLTMLGLIGGVGTVIAMVAAGQGARESVADVFRSMGTNLLIISNGSQRQGGVAGGTGSSFALTWDDFAALENGEVSTVRWVSPVLATKMQVAAEDTNWNTQVTGTNAAFFKIKNWDVTEGKLFDDDVGPAKIALIGKTVATTLYPGVNPIGQAIRINGQPYEVTGILASKGQSAMGQDQDDIVVVPVKTYLAKLDRGAGKFITRGQIYVSTESENDITRAEQQISELLRQRHNLGPNDEDDFRIRNLAEFALRQKESTDKITTLLALVAAMALLVGGIGVMNIMLVSVIERTREIGIRMAVGAKPLDVMTQFLVESLMLSLIGGAIGLAMGAWWAKLMADFYGWKFLFPAQTAVIAFLISSGIGVVFGLYPAIRASLLDPITALRYET
ncbi:MAG TPA: ABC transporter permease [Kofleriaceae bacterium]|nr:ABC transporter permease [Kofleriaceae bacterium]